MQQLTLFRALFLALLCAFFLSACHWGAKEETVAKDYLIAISKGNFDKAIDMIYVPPDLEKDPSAHGKFKENLHVMLGSMKRNFYDPNGGIESIEFTGKTYAADKNQVNLQYTVTFGNGSSKSSSINLVLIGKTWRIRAR